MKLNIFEGEEKEEKPPALRLIKGAMSSGGKVRAYICVEVVNAETGVPLAGGELLRIWEDGTFERGCKVSEQYGFRLDEEGRIMEEQ